MSNSTFGWVAVLYKMMINGVIQERCESRSIYRGIVNCAPSWCQYACECERVGNWLIYTMCDISRCRYCRSCESCAKEKKLEMQLHKFPSPWYCPALEIETDTRAICLNPWCMWHCALRAGNAPFEEGRGRLQRFCLPYSLRCGS